MEVLTNFFQINFFFKMQVYFDFENQEREQQSAYLSFVYKKVA